MATDLPPDGPRLRESHCFAWMLAALTFASAYAVIRYNVFKGVPWEHLPLYVVNKVAALSGVILIASSYLIGKWIRVFEDDAAKRLVLIKFLGLAGYGLIVMHVLMSLAMLSPAYYPKFFGEAKMNLTGEITILFGVLAFFWMSSPAISSLPEMRQAVGMRQWLRAQRAGYLALAFVAVHLFAMGNAGWLNPAGWPGGMPPITMLGFVIVSAPLIAKLTTRGPAH